MTQTMRQTRTREKRYRKQRQSRSRYATALHEAAHCIAHQNYGQPIAALSCAPDPESGINGYCQPVGATLPPAAPPVVRTGRYNPADRDLLDSIIVARLAGYAAERVLLGSGNWDGAQYDFDNAIALASLVNPECPAAVIIQLIPRAIQFVRDHTPDIFQLADRLAAAGTLQNPLKEAND